MEDSERLYPNPVIEKCIGTKVIGVGRKGKGKGKMMIRRQTKPTEIKGIKRARKGKEMR